MSEPRMTDRVPQSIIDRVEEAGDAWADACNAFYRQSDESGVTTARLRVAAAAARLRATVLESLADAYEERPCSGCEELRRIGNENGLAAQQLRDRAAKIERLLDPIRGRAKAAGRHSSELDVVAWLVDQVQAGEVHHG